MPKRSHKSYSALLIKADRIARRLWPGLVRPKWWLYNGHRDITWPHCPPLGRLYDLPVPRHQMVSVLPFRRDLMRRRWRKEA